MPLAFKILIVPNSFKGTLTAAQAACAIQLGLGRAFTSRYLDYPVRFIQTPIADGGDGFAAVIVDATHGTWIRRRVTNALGTPILATFGLSPDRKTAVIEMARATGLAHLHHLKPMHASSRGTGDLIRAALDRGATRILLGIGGSASTDGGTGIARALGVRFLDHNDRDLPEGGAALLRLTRIDISGLHPRLAVTQRHQRATIDVACDVQNPLFGPRGAACIFAPQKGATPAMVRRLDRGLRHLAEIIERDIPSSFLPGEIGQMPGGGAAGGAGAGLVAFLGANLRQGFDLVAEAISLRNTMRGCNLVITGEGRLDSQTAHGKAPMGVLKMGLELGIPVVAICGSVQPGNSVERLGFSRIYGVVGSRSGCVSTTMPANRREASAQLVKCCRQIMQEWIAEGIFSGSGFRWSL
ncbi:MAG TPA: glycerate kinase [Phycisphaerae bacterium]|jgi:glycerate kinase